MWLLLRTPRWQAELCHQFSGRSVWLFRCDLGWKHTEQNHFKILRTNTVSTFNKSLGSSWIKKTFNGIKMVAVISFWMRYFEIGTYLNCIAEYLCNVLPSVIRSNKAMLMTLLHIFVEGYCKATVLHLPNSMYDFQTLNDRKILVCMLVKLTFWLGTWTSTLKSTRSGCCG